MALNLQHLKYAEEVERTGSITQAAENLYMGQPNLSKAIKELERAVGFSIFKRTPRGMVPTIKGAEFLSNVKPLLRQVENLEMMYSSDSSYGNRLSIAVPRAGYMIQAFVRFVQGLDFLQDMEISFRETCLTQAVMDVAGGSCPFGIIRYRQEDEGVIAALLGEKDLEAEPLLLYEPRILLSEGHPLAEKTVIDREELEPFIELVYGDEQLPGGNSRFSGRKRIQIYERGSQFTLLSEIPMAYMWDSPLSKAAAGRYGLVQIKCRQKIPKMKDVFIYSKGHQLNQLERAFQEELVRVRSEIAKI